MQVDGAARTDVGKKRRSNEDAFAFLPDRRLFVVADGIGGLARGELASEVAVASISRSFLETEEEDLTPITDANGTRSLGGRRLVMALTEANARVLAMAGEDPEARPMGTAVAALAIDAEHGQAAICHVGDARVYRVRNGTIELMTEDHTLVRQLLRDGRIGPDELTRHPQRHVLTRALGTGAIVRPDLRVESLWEGDVFVLCSDGVHGAVDDTEILDVIRLSGEDFEAICGRLIAIANDRGGNDNSTVVVAACRGAKP